MNWKFSHAYKKGTEKVTKNVQINNLSTFKQTQKQKIGCYF